MNDYRKLNASHRLSSYSVTIPTWHGTEGMRAPFAEWAAGRPLSWYGAYNAIKHDRHDSFHLATLKQLTEAVCGLVALLAAQFYTYDFSPGPCALLLEGPGAGSAWA